MPSKLTPSDLQIIWRVTVFRGLKPETVEHIVAPATAVTLKAHECLFQQGDPATAFFIVIEGWIKLFRITMSGEEAVIHVMTKGDSFAEAVHSPLLAILRRPKPSPMRGWFASLPIMSFAAFGRAPTSRLP